LYSLKQHSMLQYLPFKFLQTLDEHNAFYTANSGLSRTLPPSFLTKEKQILALIFMKQIEK
ncbi:hypothetical protein P7M16_14020, partial [Vibrio parahaemolyticus]|nr:hypothetical protein [Vibrio parahaemolyticus]MDG2752051.1 hypothetical protein [Vibrio parahaemolyticus]